MQKHFLPDIFQQVAFLLVFSLELRKLLTVQSFQKGTGFHLKTKDDICYAACRLTVIYQEEIVLKYQCNIPF